LVATLTLIAAGCGSTDDTDEAGSAITRPDLTGASLGEVLGDLGGDSPGCAVGVLIPDAVLLAQGGLADLGAGEPIGPDTVFDVGSVSKQITAGAVALLVARGQVALDDDVADWLPELGPYEETITVADLLHHTSGLPDYVELLDADTEDVTTTDDAIDELVSPAGVPTFSPGKQFEYSNSNYLLLAEIVESVSGQSFPDFVAAEIFGPLGMVDSVVRDDQGTLLPGQAAGYEEGANGEWNEVGSAWRQTGDGAVHSTATDLLAWSELFVSDTEIGELGSGPWLDVMIEPGPVADGDGEYGGGLEISKDDRGDVRLAHGGSWIGYGSAIAMDPNEGVAAVVTCNIDGIDAEDRVDELMAVWTGSS
jgi:CubicO group peptidase (beta-lactamase class C family)